MESGIAGGRFIRELLAGYVSAPLFVALALACSLLIQRFFPYPFLFLFFAAVMAAGWFGGAGPGIFSVILSTLAVEYFFAPPLYSWAVNTTDMAYFVAFVACALAASWVSFAKKRDAEALREARDLLEVRVAERTGELAKSITEREDAQQALIQAQSDLAHLSQALTMGELTASIAHEVNQPLTAVVTYGNACLEWLSANPPNLDEARRAADTIIKDGIRASTVLKRIRALFQKQPPSKELFDTNEAVQDLIALLRHEFVKQNVLVRTELSADLPLVKADRVQFQQVLLNLIANAVDATRGLRDRPRGIVLRSEVESPATIRVSVEDNGCGFNPELAEKIFDPFFSTKPHGTGMGLSISRSIIESHQGRLWAEAVPGGGAVFHMTLPVGV